MNRRPDVEDLQTTRTEKLLAVVLTAFLLVGGVWTYTKIDDVVRDHVRVPSAAVLQRPRDRTRERGERARLRGSAPPRRRARESRAAARGLSHRARRAQARRPARARVQRGAGLVRGRRARPRAGAARAGCRGSGRGGARSRRGKVEAAVDRQERDAFLARLVFVLLRSPRVLAPREHAAARQARWFPLAGSVGRVRDDHGVRPRLRLPHGLRRSVRMGPRGRRRLRDRVDAARVLGLQRYLLRRGPATARAGGGSARSAAIRSGRTRTAKAAAGTSSRPCSSCESPRRVGTAHCGACGATS